MKDILLAFVFLRLSASLPRPKTLSLYLNARQQTKAERRFMGREYDLQSI